MVDVPPIVTAVLLSPRVMTPVPAAVTVPFTVIALGAVAVTPPVKLMVSEPLPNAKVPVFAKVVAPAMVLVVPLIATLYALPAETVMPVVRVKSPLKVTAVDATLSVIVKDPAATGPLKVVPPELVMVKVPTSEVDVPAIVAPETAPVLKERL